MRKLYQELLVFALELADAAAGQIMHTTPGDKT